MKNVQPELLKIMKRYFFLFLLFMPSVCSTYAYDIEVDGIYYNVLSTKDLTLSLTSGDKAYTDDIVILKRCIQYEGI